MKQTCNADAIYIEEFIALLSSKISTSYILQSKFFIPLDREQRMDRPQHDGGNNNHNHNICDGCMESVKDDDVFYQCLLDSVHFTFA